MKKIEKKRWLVSGENRLLAIGVDDDDDIVGDVEVWYEPIMQISDFFMFDSCWM